MTMIADEEESKIIAKQRILKTAKRRLRAPETFIERSFDSDDEFRLQVENNHFVVS